MASCIDKENLEYAKSLFIDVDNRQNVFGSTQRNESALYNALKDYYRCDQISLVERIKELVDKVVQWIDKQRDSGPQFTYKNSANILEQHEPIKKAFQEVSNLAAGLNQ